MNERNLEGQVVVITGAAGILGQRLASAFAARGARLALWDVRGEEVTELAERVAREHEVLTRGARCDVADEEQVTAALAEAEAALGPVTVLCNNAAHRPPDRARYFAPTEQYDLDMWREVMRVNLDGAFVVAKHVGGAMVARGSGSIVMTASIYGVVGPDARIYEGSSYDGTAINTPAPYAASKAALLGLTRYLATTWASRGVRVNAVVPGGIRSGQNDAFVDAYSARVPLGRMAEADEVASAFLFLASDAARYVTGQSLAVDGGWTAW